MHTRRRGAHPTDEPSPPAFEWSISADDLSPDDPTLLDDEVIARSPCFFSMGQKWCMQIHQFALTDQHRQLQLSLQVRDPLIRSDTHVLVQYTFCKRSSPTKASSGRSASPATTSSPVIVARSSQLRLELCEGDHLHPNEYCASWPLGLAKFHLIRCFIEPIRSPSVASIGTIESDEGISVSPSKCSPRSRRDMRTPTPVPRRKRQTKKKDEPSSRKLKKTTTGVKVRVAHKRSRSLPRINLTTDESCGQKSVLDKAVQADYSDGNFSTSSTSPSTLLVATQNELIRDFARLLNNEISSDITFISPSEQKYPAHQVILRIRAPELYRKFEISAQKKEVRFAGISDAVFAKLLEFIYTGNVLNPNNHCLELYKAAKKFALLNLMELCFLIMSEDVQVEKAAEMLILARLHLKPDLESKIIQFIKRYIRDFIKTVGFKKLESYPDLLTLIIWYIAPDVGGADRASNDSEN